MDFSLLKSLSDGQIKLLSVLFAALLFFVDTVTPLEIAVAVFYTVIVLMSVSYADRREVVLIALGCVLLTVVSYALSFFGETRPGLINMAISIAAIATTTYLVLKIDSARSEAHAAREAAAHTGRVTALGEMTASIAHEVKQPLSAIVTSGNACRRWLETEPANVDKARRAVERMIADADRASEIIDHVRGLARKQPNEAAPVSLNALVRETLALISREIRQAGIELSLDLDEREPTTSGDRVQLQQVLLNLLINAIEALSQTRDRAPSLWLRSSGEDNAMVLLTVADNGPGLAGQEPDRLFEAFHTTKPEGLGIGLSMARSIVEFHGGRIEAGEHEPQGAVFRIRLPAAVQMQGD